MFPSISRGRRRKGAELPSRLPETLLQVATVGQAPVISGAGDVYDTIVYITYHYPTEN